jgi:hypothetical protein
VADIEEGMGREVVLGGRSCIGISSSMASAGLGGVGIAPGGVPGTAAGFASKPLGLEVVVGVGIGTSVDDSSSEDHCR